MKNKTGMFRSASRDIGAGASGSGDASSVSRKAAAPPARPRSKQARSQLVIFLNLLMTGLVMLAVFSVAALFYGQAQFEKAGPVADDRSFVVEEGAGIIKIASALENQGLISDARIFRVGAQMHGMDRGMKAGEYEIKGNSSMRDIMVLLESGRSVLHRLTVVEGQTVSQVFDKIRTHQSLVGDMPDMPEEGSLLADTQNFASGTERATLVSKMKIQQEELVNEIWERRTPDIPIEDINEFVTLASIVEKETGVAEERPLVASVFINRLRKNMRLQSDPTIIYGLFGGEGKPSDRPIYRSDIDKPTPYNTYIIDGLPPGPIANPGRAALEAVANPAQSDALYFVADGSGGHAFAATLDEHNANVRKWREIEKEKAAERDKTAAEQPAELAGSTEISGDTDASEPGSGVEVAPGELIPEGVVLPDRGDPMERPPIPVLRSDGG